MAGYDTRLETTIGKYNSKLNLIKVLRAVWVAEAKSQDGRHAHTCGSDWVRNTPSVDMKGSFKEVTADLKG